MWLIIHALSNLFSISKWGPWSEVKPMSVNATAVQNDNANWCHIFVGCLRTSTAWYHHAYDIQVISVLIILKIWENNEQEIINLVTHTADLRRMIRVLHAKG